MMFGKNKFTAYLQLMRFDKPIGISLLLFPTLWSLWLAAGGMPPWPVLIVFVLGVVVMRAAGCIINDIADRRFDGFVKRTKTRPLASGKVTLKEAWVLFFLLIFIAFLLVCTLNRLTIWLSLVGVGLASFYPFTKRFISLPQLFLGVAFAWSVPMGFAAIQNQLPPVAWILYAAALVLPLAYDTEYAMVDREDDLKIGIKSAAILFGRWDKAAIGLFQALFLALMFWVGKIASLGFFYYMGLSVALGCFLYQHRLIANRQPERCFKAFLNNQWVVFAVFLGAILARI